MIWTVFMPMILAIDGLNADLAPHHLSHNGIRSVDGVFPGDFTDDLFQKYGTGEMMDLDKFKALLKNLGIGQDAGNNTKMARSIDKSCFSSINLLKIFSLNASSLNKANFKLVCPAIVQQIDSKSCDNEDTVQKTGPIRESKSKAWGYGVLSVAIISCASLLGAFVVPFMSQDFYKKLLMFMVSLAVGVLGGSGIFHLLPSTFDLNSGDDVTFLYKSAVVVGGIYFFFFLEYTMKLYIRYKDGDISHDCRSGHSHSNGKGIGNGNKKDEIPGLGIAETQLELYNLLQDPTQTHTSGGLVVSNELSKKPDPSIISNVCFTPNMSPLTSLSNLNSEASVQFKETQNTKETEKRHVAPVAWMIVIGDGVHNFIDGLAIGAAYSTSAIDGLSTSLAIFCEELPHELGDFAVLLNGGMSYKQALGFNFLSACACFLGLVIGLLLGYATSAVKWIYALAGGMFLYISLVDMLQEATEMSFKEGKGSLAKSFKMFALQSFGMLFGFAIMFVLAMYQNNIQI